MPTGKPSEAPAPQSTMPITTTHRVRAEDDEQDADAGRDHRAPQHRHPAEAVDQRGAGEATDRHGGHEDGEAGHADGVRDVVAVDEGDREPVVGGALGGGQRQHHHPDQQGARLEPGASGRGRAPPRGSRRSAGSVGEVDHTSDQRQRDHGHEVQRRPARQLDHQGTQQRTDHGAGTEAGMEARHDRAAQTALDLGALDVHGDVPHADADAVDEEPDGRQASTSPRPSAAIAIPIAPP